MGADENMVDKVDGVGDGPGRVVIKNVDVDAGVDADVDGDDERPLVAEDEMGVRDHDLSRPELLWKLRLRMMQQKLSMSEFSGVQGT